MGRSTSVYPKTGLVAPSMISGMEGAVKSEDTVSTSVRLRRHVRSRLARDGDGSFGSTAISLVFADSAQGHYRIGIHTRGAASIYIRELGWPPYRIGTTRVLPYLVEPSLSSCL